MIVRDQCGLCFDNGHVAVSYTHLDVYKRQAQLLAGSKSDFLFVADSGPGETDQKGLIVPKFGSKPENHVAVSMTFETFSELLLTTRLHYSAWLGAWYANQYHPGSQRTCLLYTSRCV